MFLCLCYIVVYLIDSIFQQVAKTVSGYLDLATSMNFANVNVDPRTFLTNVSKYNPQLARNLYLLCGDPSLELVARSLEQKRDQHFSVSQFGLQAWKSVTLCLQSFITRIAERKVWDLWQFSHKLLSGIQQVVVVVPSKRWLGV